MRIGVNYPWRDYGWDFGVAPAQWRPSNEPPRWYAVIDEHLRLLRSHGVSVVRWFVLADGLTYGSGPQAPTPGDKGAWRFDPPALTPDFLAHFRELLHRFAAVNKEGGPPLQLLPVLVDFHFCGAGVWPLTVPDPADPRKTVPDRGWVKQGRADVIADPAKRARFFARALDPLLAITRDYRDLVYAWDLMNEPDWVTRGWHARRLRDRSVDASAMRAFLEEGVAHVRGSGQAATVGFASLRTLRKARVAADVDQFHHYPAGRHTLRRCEPISDRPLIIGELATAMTDEWPELRATGQTAANRLRLAATLGYPMAIAWSFLATDRHSDWQRAAADFAAHAQSPTVRA